MAVLYFFYIRVSNRIHPLWITPCKVFWPRDIRSVGSGNIGATNVLRTGKKSLAIATLLLDGGKGTLATFIAIQFGPDMGVAAAGAIIGHCFPAWLKFRGGKGVATGLGIFQRFPR